MFDEFLGHAEHYLRGNRVAQAGVIAGVVFEDTVRRICNKHTITEAGIRVDQLITELARREIILDVTAKRARVGADVRTSATHAQWREFAEGDVQETIRITRELIEQHLAS